jgi:AcrR family transcriptional regulator
LASSDSSTAPKVRRTRGDQLTEILRKDPKEALIRAADHALERLGPQAATVRVITSLANTNTSAINYHFQSRENLLTEVGRRRMDNHNERISERLAELEAAGGRPSVAQVFRPLVETAFGVWAKDPVLKALRTMVFVEPTAIQSFSTSQVDQIYRRMLASLMTACPHLSPADIDWRYRLSLGTIMYQLMIADARMVSPLAKTIDVDRVVEFVSAAFTKENQP